MRYLFFIALSVFLGFVAALGTWLTPAGGESISVEPQELDFALVDPAAPPSLSIKLRNGSSSPAEITVAADCTCVSISKRSFTLPARSHARVEILLRATYGEKRSGIIGRIDQKLTITSKSVLGIQTHVLPVSAQYLEPFVYDAAACDLNGFMSGTQR